MIAEREVRRLRRLRDYAREVVEFLEKQHGSSEPLTARWRDCEEKLTVALDAVELVA